MHDLKKLYTSFFWTRIAVFLLVFVLIGLESLMLNSASDSSYLNQAALQRTRCEIFARSAFVLAYRPAAERTMALSDLQFVLPLFQQEQTVLLTNTNVNIQTSLWEAQPDYLTMVTAVNSIIASPDRQADPGAINAIIAHRQSCVTTMNNIVVGLQQAIENRHREVFYTEVAIECLIILFFSALLIFPGSSIAQNGR